MTDKPNILIILADGMQADALLSGHACQTPNFDRVAARGIRFRQAHTTCPTCSPARASLMTGLLPHNHGVLEVEHGRDEDQCVLRDHPHFAQRLTQAGYQTGYFGKWHIERTEQVNRFGWRDSVVKSAAHVAGMGQGDTGPRNVDLDPALVGYLDGPTGYRRILHWGVTDTPLETRYPGVTVADAERYLDTTLGNESPWCCLVSFSEPNEALVVGRQTWEQYAADEIPLPENFMADMSDRPNIYRREQAIGRAIEESDWRAARACYFGRITELDTLSGRLLDKIDAAGQLENTIVIVTSDHGRYVGAHGFEAHNFGAFEEIYRIPLVIAGPGVAMGEDCNAQVSIADLCPTICQCASAAPIESPDSNALNALLASPKQIPDSFASGYAEYHGTRFPLMQRILWRDGWKFVFNGFDFDELYDLRSDPHEMTNRIDDESQRSRIIAMMSEIWRYVRDTGDRAIHESHYFSLRLAAVGPDCGDPNVDSPETGG